MGPGWFQLYGRSPPARRGAGWVGGNQEKGRLAVVSWGSPDTSGSEKLREGRNAVFLLDKETKP